MECRDSILSNEYYDVIADFAINQYAPEVEPEDFCHISIEDYYHIVYLNRQALINPNEYF